MIRRTTKPKRKQPHPVRGGVPAVEAAAPRTEDDTTDVQRHDDDLLATMPSHTQTTDRRSEEPSEEAAVPVVPFIEP